MSPRWCECLGVSEDWRSFTYYQLLGVGPGERDPMVLEAAALTRSAWVRTLQMGFPQECTSLLNAIARALVTLLDPVKREKYEATLDPTSGTSLWTPCKGRPQLRPSSTVPSGYP